MSRDEPSQWGRLDLVYEKGPLPRRPPVRAFLSRAALTHLVHGIRQRSAPCRQFFLSP